MGWLEEAEARANAATEAPWFWREFGERDEPMGPQVDLGAYVQGDPAKGSGSVISVDACDACMDDFASVRTKPPDAEFIAAARTDLPRALALVRQLGDALDSIVHDVRGQGGSIEEHETVALAAYRDSLALSEEGN